MAHPVTRTLGALLCLTLAACQTLPSKDHVHISEMESFTAMAADKRVMNSVKIRWEARDDVVAYCAQALGMDQERANTTPPLACAVWSVKAKECTIVTGRVTTHVALGHEVRHCFEGHFHR